MIVRNFGIAITHANVTNQKVCFKLKKKRSLKAVQFGSLSQYVSQCVTKCTNTSN